MKNNRAITKNVSKHRKSITTKLYLLCLTCLLFGSSTILNVNAQTVNSESIYKIRNQCSNRLLDVAGANRQNGARVIQWNENGGRNQLWKFVMTDSGYYKLIAQHSQKVLDVSGAQTIDGSNVIQWTYGGRANQQWRITDAGNGFSKFEPRHAAGKFLNVLNSSTSGSRVQILTAADSCNQRWRLELADPGFANAHYVATDGNDSNPGTFTQPFRTIQRCAADATPGETCYIRGGKYRETVTPQNSGANGAPIRFEAFPGEEVIISGADTVSGGWEVYQNQIYRTSLTLPVNGYNDTGFLANQIFVDGRMMNEARYPNTGFALLEPTLAGGTVIALNEFDVRVENSGIPNLPEGWAGATVWQNEWYVSRTGTISGGENGILTGRMSSGWGRNGYWFYLTNKLGLLDSPGEWFYDGNTNQLYFWARNGGIPTNVEAKKRNFAFDLSDRSHIEIKNIKIFAATVTTNAASSNLILDGLRVKYVSHHVTLPPPPPSELAPVTANSPQLASHAYDTGIQLRGTNHTLKNSVIEYSSGNGVMLKGNGHTIDNNIVTDSNYQSSYAASVRINGDNHRITRNTISGAGRDAIIVDWNTAGLSFQNSEIAYNDITRFGALSNDLGAIYTCCYTNLNNTRIHHNSIHNPYGFSFFWDVAGIYTDIDSYNATVDHNVVWNMTTRLPKGLKIAGSASRGGTERIHNNTLFAPSNLPTEAAFISNNILGDPTPAAPLANNLYSEVNPLLTNPVNGEFTPLIGSPAIDTGIIIPGITDGYNGSAPDIGAFEFGQTQWRAGSNLNDASTIGQSLFTSQIPNRTDIADGVSYEMGVKLQSNVSGRILAVRYWKPYGETGAHTGRIWSADGTLLASVEFTNETDGGWQQARMTTPLPISANTTYVVSVNANSHYPFSGGSLTTSFRSGNLSTTADGSNGVFGNIGTFPAQSFNNANYFRDVSFVADGQ